MNVVFNLKSEKVKNWRTYFTFSGLATALVLGLLPSLFDSVTDFLLAKEEETTKSLGSKTHPRLGYSWSLSANLTYFFISLPLHYWMMIFTRLLATKCCSRCSQYRVCRGTASQGVSKWVFNQNEESYCSNRHFQNPGTPGKGGGLTHAKIFLVDLIKCTKANLK